MPLLDTTGNNTEDAYQGGGAAAVIPYYIEDMFSTYLYTGTGAARTIVNGIDLATKGGMIWIKDRTTITNHNIEDTVQGITKNLAPNSTAAAATVASGDDITSFNTNGWTFGNNNLNINNNGDNFASWTFRKQPKFFDVLTYTGDGSSNRQIAHNLGSAPGCVIVKRTDTSGSWVTYHRGLTSADYAVFLNYTNAQTLETTYWNSTSPTSTNFTVGSSGSTNASGGSFVAYLFAHNAGGFGLTGTDNVITCGSVVGSSQVEVNLGYEPQWILVKNASAAQDWWLVDNMRGLPVQNNSGAYNASNLRPNLPDAETTGFSIAPSATGFKANVLTAGQTYIYITIRRGPMKVPTDATKVFDAETQTGGSFVTTNFPVDLIINTRQSAGTSKIFGDRLRGGTVTLDSTSTAAESNFSPTSVFGFTYNTGVEDDYWSSAAPSVYWNFRRAPSFFDEICYTGTGSATTQAHNLGVVPELIIVKCRSTGGTNRGWWTYVASLGNTQALYLNTSDNAQTAGIWNNTTPTSTVFSIDGTYLVNGSGATYVAYLFATCPGVSKVGSYTGNGTSQAIACGFTGGARFVLIKRTDSTGDWYVYDTARGMTTLTDPYLLMNSTAAETATLGSVTTTTGGFTVNSAILAAINTSSATYIFLAIA